MCIKIKIGQRQQLIPDGEYRVKLSEVKEGSYIGKRKTLEFHFLIADGEHHGVLVRGFVNAHYETFSEHTKLYRWIKAVSNECLDPGEELDLDVLYEKILRVQISTKESKKTKNKFSNVTDILGVYLDLD